MLSSKLTYEEKPPETMISKCQIPIIDLAHIGQYYCQHDVALAFDYGQILEKGFAHRNVFLDRFLFYLRVERSSSLRSPWFLNIRRHSRFYKREPIGSRASRLFFSVSLFWRNSRRKQNDHNMERCDFLSTLSTPCPLSFGRSNQEMSIRNI